jgi:hypothetical protein
MPPMNQTFTPPVTPDPPSRRERIEAVCAKLRDVGAELDALGIAPVISNWAGCSAWVIDLEFLRGAEPIRVRIAEGGDAECGATAKGSSRIAEMPGAMPG